MSIERHTRAYRALLTLYPRQFRATYADPMVQLFGDCLRERGPRAWLGAAADLARSIPKQRIEVIVDRLSPAARVLALAFIVLGAVVVSVGFGGPAVAIVALAVVAVAIGQRRLFGSMPFGPRAPLRRAVIQTWWAPIAALLGIAMVLFGVGTVFEAHNLGGRIFGSAASLAFGGSMLFGLKRRPFDRTAGNALVLLSTIPAFPLFWLIVPAVLALVVWIGVLTSGFADRELQPT